jgi:demethylspheroidene O-methyltransferase
MSLFSGVRDRLVTRPGFRAWAARFWLTRPIARRRARALFDLCAGFTYSQILLACVELDVFARLSGGPRSVGALAPGFGLGVEATERLLAAAAALGLVERRGDAYGLGPLGAAMVDNPAVAAMVRHHGGLYADLADPVGLLRAGQGAMAGYWAYARAAEPGALGGHEVAAYSELMAASQPLVAAEVLDAYDVRRHRVLMDVAGGDGRFLVAAGARAPGLQLVLFDLPAVAARAEARFAEAGVTGRSRIVGGDVFRDALPGGCDLVSLVRVVHDHDDAGAMAILRAVRAALAAGGTLLLAEPMAGVRGAETVGDAYFGMYLLAMGSGRARTPRMLCAMLLDAGFRTARLRRTATPLQTGLIVAVT